MKGNGRRLAGWEMSCDGIFGFTCGGEVALTQFVTVAMTRVMVLLGRECGRGVLLQPTVA